MEARTQPEPDAVTASGKPRMRTGSVWMPLSFIFLLLGVLLGFLTALTMNSKLPRGGAQAFSLGLSVSKVGENLSVKWNPQAPALRLAHRGALEINDGSYIKSVDLDAAQLRNGSLIYRNLSSIVRFRLMIYPSEQISVTESIEWSR